MKGFVVSDWGATHDSASDNANAGLDMEQPGDYIFIGMYKRCLFHTLTCCRWRSVRIPSQGRY